MFSNDRNELRNVFFAAWKKHQQQLPIEPLEAQVIDIIVLHPEYHPIMNDPEKFQAIDFAENNPFLHMSLHLALREQISTNRPQGIKEIYEILCQQLANPHDAEHHMVECLGTVLWDAQQNGVMPDEQIYLEALQKII
jgi:hypothetical protein